MFRQAPRFWWTAEKTLAARLLWPAGALYGAVTTRRMARAGRRVGVPVICVGNFVAGGAGKTPTAMKVARKLIARGERPAFLSRGYGGTSDRSGVLRVDPERHRASEAGDEPLLLGRVAPTFVSADRCAAARAAIAAGATVLVLDDGLQSPALDRDAAIAVVDGEAGVGNGLCIPAGPLRAPLDRQWPTVSLLCVLGAGTAGWELSARASSLGVPTCRAWLRPDAAALAGLQGRRLYAFSGIGRPEKFFSTLEEQRLSLVGRRAFPDHHAFGERDRLSLLDQARRLGADLVTTEKDRVRLPADFPVLTLPVVLEFADDHPVDALLDRLLARRISALP